MNRCQQFTAIIHTLVRTTLPSFNFTQTVLVSHR